LPGKVFLSLGMGLLICRSIITAHGGQLWVANNLAHGADAQAAAESCFQQALDIACRQQAKALELRALISLSRLWQQHGKRAQAHGVLAELYGWFTEGFDTVDLQEAKVLLLALEG
jgi:hypothetical protein